MKRLAIAFAFAVSVASVLAQTAFWTGDTTGDPTWNRPVGFGSLSSVGTAVPYEVQPFYVSISGQYVFELAGNRGGTFTHPDTYALVYATSFDASSPLANLMNGDDDYSDAFTLLTGSGSGFASSRIAFGDGSNFSTDGLDLSAGVQYYAVVAGFGNEDFGTYEAAIGGGQGAVTLGTLPVPEPTTTAALGMGALALLRRRRKR